MNLSRICLIALLQLIIIPVFAQNDKFIIPRPDVLKQHVGKVDTVFGTIYGGAHLKDAGVTLLSLGDNYPDQQLSIIIRDDDLIKFKPLPEVFYKNKMVSVVGKVELIKGHLQIIVKDTSQLHLPISVRKNYKNN